MAIINNPPVGNLSGTQVQVIAADNVNAGVMVLHRIITPAAAGNTDVVLTHQTRVADAWFVKTGAGAAGNTLTVQNGANAISNAMSTNIADNIMARAGTIDDAQHTIAAAGTLRITTAGGGDVAAIVYVLGFRI